MRAGFRFGLLPRRGSVLTSSLTVLPVLLAFAAATPARAAAPTHREAHRAATAPVTGPASCDGHRHDGRHSHRLRGGGKCKGGGVTGYEQVSNTQTCGNDTFCMFTATCPPGKVVTGGGITTNTFISSGVYQYESGPISTTTWRATIRNVNGGPFQVTVWAVCVNAG